MKDTDEKIDLLLQRNAEQQLAGFDWDELKAAISNRLNEVQKCRASARKYPIAFKIAAGIAAAAAVVLIIVMIKLERPVDMQLGNGRTAMVKFADSKGSASVEIKSPSGRAHVIVDIGRNRMLAKCNVEIIDSNGSQKGNGAQAAWIIVSRPESIYADNGVNQDAIDMICLF